MEQRKAAASMNTGGGRANVAAVLLTEPLPVFSRGNEGPDHFGFEVVATKGIQFVEPEVITAQV